MKKLFPAILAVTLLFFAGCKDGQKEILLNVPSNALVYMQINEPKKVIKDAQVIMEKLYIDYLLEGQNLTEFADQYLASNGTEIRMSDFNLNLPLAFTFLPNQDGGPEPGSRGFIPVKDPQDFLDKLLAQAPETTEISLSTTENYFIYDIDSDSGFAAGSDFGSNTGLNSSSSLEPLIPLDINPQIPLDQGTLSFYTNIKRLMAQNGYNIEDFFQDLKNDLLQRNSWDRQKFENSFSLAYYDWLERFAKDLQDLWAIVTVTPEVLALDYNIGFVEGSQMLKSIESMVSDQNPREMLRYLPKDSVFNLASAIDAQSLKKIGQDMVLGMRNEEESSFLEEYANRALNGLDLVSDTAALSLNFTITEALFEPLDFLNPENHGDRFSGLELEFFLLTKVKDDLQFEAYLDSLFDGVNLTGVLKDLVEYYGGQRSNTEIDFSSLDIVFELKDNPLSLPFYNKELTLKLNPTASLPESLPDSPLFKGQNLFKDMPIHIAVEDGLAMLSVGDPRSIKEILLGGLAPEESMAEMEGLDLVLKTAPQDLSLIANFSTGPFSEVFNVRSAGMMGLVNTKGVFPGLVGYMSLGESSLNLGAGMAFEELSQLIGPYVPLFLMSRMAP